MKVVVVGAGAFGAWTSWHLQRSGAQVTLVEQAEPAHPKASSGGATRVTRFAYGGDSRYAELVVRSLALWRQLENFCKQPLFEPTGLIWLHQEDNPFVRDALAQAEHFGVKVEEVSHAKVAELVPGLRTDGVPVAYWEPEAGVLAARRSCELLVRSAIESGARRVRAQVPSLEGGTGVTVDDGDGLELDSRGNILSLRLGGQRLDADRYVFAAGFGLRGLFPSLLGHLLAPTRQEVFFLEASARQESLPILFELGERSMYVFRDVFGRGVKVGCDSRRVPFEPARDSWKTTAAGLAAVRSYLERRLPELASAPVIASKVCAYVNTPSCDLLVDRHPAFENVWLAGGGSGHGFKLSAAIGERLARWVTHEDSEGLGAFSLEALGLARSKSPYGRRSG